MIEEKKAFTLVELVVVITILAILATIGFVSFSGYLVGTRDTNRIAQLKSMSDALELYRTKKDLPIPDDKIDIKANGSVFAYQGYIGKNVLETIEYTESGLDPKDKTYFSYYLTKNKKYFQLLAFLEEENKDVQAMKPHPNPFLKGEGIIGKSFATDYSERIPKTTGKKLGILTDDNNIPIQEVSAITGSGYLDVAITTDSFQANINDGNILKGTGSTLGELKILAKNKGKGFACKEILNNGVSYGNGIYKIFNGKEIFEVLCDMTNDGGGWTLVDGVSDRFGQYVTSTPEDNPNINNYSMSTDKLYGLLNNIEHPTFKYKIDRNGGGTEDTNLELNIQVDDVQGYLKAYKRNLTDGEEVPSTSWVTMNGTIIQPKKTNNFTRITLRSTGGGNGNYGHLKSYSQQGPHSWWLGSDGHIGGLYLNKIITTVSTSNLPTFGGLFDWDTVDGYYLVVHGETKSSGGYKWSDYNILLGKNIKAGLWVR